MTIEYPPSPWLLENTMSTGDMDNCINFYDAAVALYKAKRVEAIATLRLYLYNPSAVSDHSNFMADVDKWLTVLTDSEDKLAALNEHLCATTRVEEDHE